MKVLKYVIMIIFFTIFIITSIFAKYNILILNSYHQTLEWTDSLVKNITSSLKDENFYIEYMDTKRFPREKIFKIFNKYLNEKYKNKKIDILIVTDNNALDFTVKNKNILFNKLPVIFCGINNFTYAMLKGFKDITGVVEGVDIKGTIDAILKLQPNIKNIVAVMGANFTSQLYYNRIVNLQKKYSKRVNIKILNGLFYDKTSYTEQLKKLPEKSAILYLNLFKFKDGSLFGIKDSVDYVFQNTGKPIYLMWDVMLNYPGVVGGKITSSRLQALSVVKFVKKILYKKIPAENLPIITKPPTEYVFDYKELKRFNISLENFKYPYVLINKPLEVYKQLEKKQQILQYLEIFLLILACLIGVLFYNIKKRKITEKSLKSEIIQFLTLLNSMQDIVVMKSPDGKWLYINKVAEKFFNLKESDYIGKTTEELIEKLPFKKSSITAGLPDEEVWKKREPCRYMQDFVTLNNEKIYFDVSKIPVFNSDGTRKCLIATGRDITYYKKLQDKLILTQKMDIIGKLAGGIAHDFNNILTVILNNAEMCKLSITEDKDIVKFIDNIIFSTERAGLLVRHLLTFAKKDVHSSVATEMELNTTVKSITKILKPLIPENIKLSFIPCKTPITIYANDVELEQIITNLTINAKDAVLDTKNKDKFITISINKVFLDENFFKTIKKGLSAGEYALIEIEDNGIGISEENKEKIFEPFFSTKNDKRGTGLGLSTVIELVEKNNGFILFNSKLGNGSTFKVYFPIADRTFEINNKSTERLDKIGKNLKLDLNILFVEDNLNILNSIPENFKKIFNKFIIAENGAIALQKIKKNASPPDILITDIVMPEMDGIELANYVKNLYPEIEIIFVSGYDSGKLKNVKFDYQFLYKPYTFETILELILKRFGESL